MKSYRKKILSVLFLMLIGFLFSGATSDYYYEEYRVEGYYPGGSYQIVINDYEEYVKTCDKFNIKYTYKPSYFEDNCLVTLYKEIGSSSYILILKDITIKDNEYIITFRCNSPMYIVLDIAQKVYFINEKKGVLDDNTEIKVNVVQGERIRGY